MDLLENAVRSLRVALADFSKDDDERLLSVVRNIHAGILLLCKEKLASLSPDGSDDVLLKRHIVPRKTKPHVRGACRQAVTFEHLGTLDQEGVRSRSIGVRVGRRTAWRIRVPANAYDKELPLFD